MSRSRLIALAAVIVVPVAILAIVLASLIESDDSNSPPSRTVARPSGGTTGAGPTGATAPSAAVPAQPGTGGARVPKTSLHVLDRGATPKDLGDKLAPASADGTLTLGDLRGSPIVLNVWSADCAFCLAEAPLLESEWERLGRRGVLFLGLDVLDSPAAAKRFRADHRVTYPAVDEKRAATARAMGATGVPETFFISKDGDLVGHVIGKVSLGQIELGVRAAESGQPMPTEQGGGQIPLH